MQFHMRSGYVVDFNHPRIEYLPMEDVLFALAREHRFFNQIDWSVLQHSLACGVTAAMYYPDNRPLIIHAFCHDLTEAFLRDVPSPVKTADYKKIEATIQKKIYDYLNIEPLAGDDEKYLHEIDMHMRLVEAWEFYPTRDCYDAIKEEMGNDVDPDLVILCTQAMTQVMGVNIWHVGEDNIIDMSVVAQFVVDQYRELTNNFTE